MNEVKGMARVACGARAMLRALLLLTLSEAALAQDAERVTAFVDVNVVPMDRERVLPRQTVIVRGDRIVAVGPAAEVAVPEDAARIEGRGTRYLIPGLADMHTHVAAPEDVALYLASGVTTALHMGGNEMPPIKLIQTGVANGSLVSPQIYFSLKVDAPTSLFDGWSVDTPASARAVVQAAKVGGFRFIKLYNEISEPVFDALVEAARENGLAVIGHGVRAIGLPQGLFRGQVMVAHAEEFLYTAFAHGTDTAAIPEVVRQTAESGAYVTAGLSTFEVISAQFGRPAKVHEYLADPRASFMSLGARGIWLNQGYAHQKGDLRERLAFLRQFTRALADRGVPLMTGTDSPVIPGLVPGDSMHAELASLTRIGLSNFQALSAATRIPGEFIAAHIPGAARFGVVASGQRADLVLLQENPLTSLANLRAPLGVMSAGHWRTSAQLQAVLDDNARKMEAVVGSRPARQ